MTKEPIIYVNGAFVPQSEARISVLDHAVLYGDGVFETAVARAGSLFKLEQHVDRCYRSLSAISLAPPWDRSRMTALIVETVRRNEIADAYVKWIVTRGSNGRPLMDPAGCEPNLIILALPYIERTERLVSGVRLKTVAVRRPPGHVLDARIKSLNYLNLVLAKIEAKAAGADDALLLDINGRIAEAAGWNLFVLSGDRLATPRSDILLGITRETVIELAPRVGLSVEAADLELYDAYTADEAFLASTAGGLLPVTIIDGRPVGPGTPGPRFRQLRAAYEELIASGSHGTSVYRN